MSNTICLIKKPIPSDFLGAAGETRACPMAALYRAVLRVPGNASGCLVDRFEGAQGWVSETVNLTLFSVKRIVTTRKVTFCLIHVRML